MATFTDNLEVLIAALSGADTFSDISFVPAYNINKAERPLRNKLCAVGIRNSYVQSNVYSYEIFELKIYTPRALGGTECLKTAGDICEYLLGAISGIVSATTESVKYDSDFMAFSCELNIKCKTMEVVNNNSEIVPDSETVSVEINGNSFDARYINAHEKSDIHYVKQALESTPVEFLKGKTYHQIEIKSFPVSILDMIEELDDFNILFDSMMYKHCRIMSTDIDLGRGIVNKLVIYAKEREAVFG